MTIERTTQGYAGFFLDKMEEVDGSDINIEKKVKLFGALGKEVRGAMSLDIQFRKLLMQSPEVARDKKATMAIGAGASQAKPLEEPATGGR